MTFSNDDFKNERFLHVYAQHRHHFESFIVGNRVALLALKEMIDEALKEGDSGKYFSPSDGEGYEVCVIAVPDDGVELFESLEMPYTAQYGEVNSHSYYIRDLEGNDVPCSPVTLLKNNEESS